MFIQDSIIISKLDKAQLLNDFVLKMVRRHLKAYKIQEKLKHNKYKLYYEMIKNLDKVMKQCNDENQKIIKETYNLEDEMHFMEMNFLYLNSIKDFIKFTVFEQIDLNDMILNITQYSFTDIMENHLKKLRLEKTEYIQLYSLSNIVDKIIYNLDDKNKKFISDFNDLKMELYSKENEYIYIKGIRDTIKFFII